MREEILQSIVKVARNGEVACADAHEVAASLKLAPIEVGKAVNRATELRFNRCQLGLFGYGPKQENKHKIVLPAQNIPDDIRAALLARVNANAISCQAVWEIAAQFKYPRLGIANIVKALGLKVAPCQLGCF